MHRFKRLGIKSEKTVKLKGLKGIVSTVES